jgi:Sec-independent protein secretion pathway component TatC
MLMAVPTYLLYELSIILARFVAPKTVPHVEAAVE